VRVGVNNTGLRTLGDSHSQASGHLPIHCPSFWHFQSVNDKLLASSQGKIAKMHLLSSPRVSVCPSSRTGERIFMKFGMK
jgi:hypothetical protein